MHTPYDGSSKLFQIGLKPLDLAQWIDVDGGLAAYLAEKERLLAAYRDEVFVAEPGTENAQAEVLALLGEHLPKRFPDTYRREGNAIAIIPAGRTVALNDEPSLLTAARLVQEDLVLLRQGEAGWRVAAGSLSFPSSWSLREKFGRLMHEVHGPVPGFSGGTRNAELIERMFTNLRPEIAVIRWNWSLYGDDRLHHPEIADPTRRRFGEGERAANVFLRVERQTLRRLPQSHDIAFTIRIYLDPLEALETHPDARTMIPALVTQLEGLTDEQLEYKGMTLERDRLLARLRETAPA
jgi:hypothetical protein